MLRSAAELQPANVDSLVLKSLLFVYGLLEQMRLGDLPGLKGLDG
jgi:hypothetical protein